MTEDKEKKGFATMDPEKQKEIARMGGETSHVDQNQPRIGGEGQHMEKKKEEKK